MADLKSGKSGSRESGFSEGSDNLENFKIRDIPEQRLDQRLYNFFMQQERPETALLPQQSLSGASSYLASRYSFRKKVSSPLANADPEDPKPLSSTTESCICFKNVIDELRTQRGFRLLDVLDEIVDIFVFKIPFQGYPKSPIDFNKRFRSASVSKGMNIEHRQMNIRCRSSKHSIFDKTRIYSYENLRSRIQNAAKRKDINSIKFFLMLAKENEIKDLCDVLFFEEPIRIIRHIVEEFLKSRLCRQYKNEFRILKIWLGNKAPIPDLFTDRHIFIPYNTFFDTVVVIVEQSKPQVRGRFVCGFHLVVVSENECNTEAYRLLQFESHEPTELSIMSLPESRISDLMNKHSNITLINTSSIRSMGYHSQKFKIKRTPTIVIYCQVKGVIPLGEVMFPERINGFRVDVREGMCGFSGKTLRLSEHISAEECTKFGTLGGFIDRNPDVTAFVTCAHVVLPTNVLKNNTASEYARRREIKVFDKERREIGRLTKAVFNHGQPAEVSVDAALVEITDAQRYPCDGNFADVVTDNQLNGAGFSREQGPHFSNGQIEQISTFNFRKQIIKVGASSGITLGSLRIGRSCAQIIDDCDVNIDGSFPVRLFGQLEVLPRVDPSQPSDSQQAFVSDGDSGALVFAICNESPIVLKCIGIVVARTSYGTCLMTPIDKVLDALDLPYNCLSKFSIPSSHQPTDSEDLRSLLMSITQQLTAVQSNMATKGDIQNTNESIGNLKSDLEKFNDRLTMAEEEIQRTRAAGNDYGQ